MKRTASRGPSQCACKWALRGLAVGEPTTDTSALRQALPQQALQTEPAPSCATGERADGKGADSPTAGFSNDFRTPFPTPESFVCLLVCVFLNKGLLKAYYVPGPALSTGITKRNKAKSRPLRLQSSERGAVH